jgi:hypothetical protein
VITQNRIQAKVGVAPGTTTIKIDGGSGLGSFQWFPMPTIESRNAAIQNGGVQKPPQYLDPYATVADMRGQVGMPSEVNPWRTGNEHGKRSTTTIKLNHGNVSIGDAAPGLGGMVNETNPWRTGDEHGKRSTTVLDRKNGEWTLRGPDGLSGAGLGSPDLGAMVTGEVIRSLSGGLGAIPTDDSLSVYAGGGYRPVHSGWVESTTPDGKPFYAPNMLGNGAATAVTQAPSPAQTPEQAAAQAANVDELVSLQRGQTIMQVISTVAISILAVSALVSAFRK